MAIKSIEDSKVLKKYGKQLGREGIAKRVIEIAKEITTEEGAYISTIRLAGKIRALALACGADCYWDEKQYIGFQDMLWEARKATNTPCSD